MAFILPGTNEKRKTTLGGGFVLPGSLDAKNRARLSETQVEELHKAGFSTISQTPAGTPRIKEPTAQERITATEQSLKERGLKGIEFNLPGIKKTFEVPATPETQLAISAGTMAKTIQEEIARSGASVVLTYANVARFLTGQATVDEIDISGKPLENQILRAIFGDRPLESIERRIALGEIEAKRIGQEIAEKGKFGAIPLPKELGLAIKEQSTTISPLAIGAIITLDFTGAGGSAKALNALSKANKVDDVLKIFKTIGVADDLARQFAPTVAGIKDIKEISKIVNRIDEIQKTTKVAPQVAKDLSPFAPKGGKTYQTINEGGVIKSVKGKPVKIVDGVETFIHQGDNPKRTIKGFVVSEKSTGRYMGSGTTEKEAIANAKDAIDSSGVDKFKKLISENQLSERTIPPDLQPLAQEARKYKSAEEFVTDVEKANLQSQEILRRETGYKPEKVVFTKQQQHLRDLFVGKNSEATALTKAFHEQYPGLKDTKDIKSQLIDFYNQAVGGVKAEIKQTVKVAEEVPQLKPAVIRGETFTLGVEETTQPTVKELRANLKAEIKATKKEIKNAEIAEQKALKLETRRQNIRKETIENINRQRGDTERIKNTLKSKYLSDEDIANVVLEDGTKLSDTVKVKRNADKTLSTVIKKSEIEDISKKYTDEIPKEKWGQKSALVEGIEIPLKAAKSIELPYAWFERKGLSQLYDPIIQAGRDAETQKQIFLKRFEDAGLYKKGGWFTANRFNLSKSEAEGISKYYLTRQGKGLNVALTDLSPRSQKFVEVFDSIIKETEPRFFDTAKKLGKEPGKVENYAPLMTREDIELVDKGGAADWLFRKHPAFFSLKERVKNVPVGIYELDYRKVASGWLEGVTEFMNFGETTNHLKYLTESEQFKGIVKEQDVEFIANWLKDITTVELPSTLGGQSLNALSRLLRKGVAMGSLGLNYASVLKQALTQIPLTIIEKAPPKLVSEYAKAFGIKTADLPSITKRVGDIAIRDLQGKVGRIFTGPLTKFDKLNAQASLNALLDKNYTKFLKEGVEITPEARALIEKKSMDTLDVWYGGFFKGQRPEAFRKELGNFILMFLYPLTSQLNGFFRYIARAKGLGDTAKASAEVLASAVAIAYLEQVIENLSPQWSDEQGMTKDILLSLAGNIPVAGNIAYALANETEIQASPTLGSINNIVKKISKGEGVSWAIAETFGLPKQVRRIKEGMEIMEAGGITDDEGKMLAPVQDTMELVRSFLRGKYGSIASQDWVRNIGEKTEDRRWFIPQVEFLQNGDYERKAELYKSFDRATKKELYDFLSEGQQKKLDKELEGTKKSRF